MASINGRAPKRPKTSEARPSLTQSDLDKLTKALQDFLEQDLQSKNLFHRINQFKKLRPGRYKAADNDTWR